MIEGQYFTPGSLTFVLARASTSPSRITLELIRTTKNHLKVWGQSAVAPFSKSVRSDSEPVAMTTIFAEPASHDSTSLFT
jgi:hypothetical protein